MKIITILFILFTLVISTEIRDETTLGSVGNEENNYVNITETTKTTEENKENVSSFKIFFGGEPLYFVCQLIKYVSLLMLACHIIEKYKKYILPKDNSNENRKLISRAITKLLQIIILTFLTYWILKVLVITLILVSYIFDLLLSVVSYIGTILGLIKIF